MANAAKAPLEASRAGETSKNPRLWQLPGKLVWVFKSVQKSRFLLKNCGCQSAMLGSHLLCINDSTSDGAVLQYQNIGNIKVSAAPNGSCERLS